MNEIVSNLIFSSKFYYLSAFWEFIPEQYLKGVCFSIPHLKEVIFALKETDVGLYERASPICKSPLNNSYYLLTSKDVNQFIIQVEMCLQRKILQMIS